MDRYLNIFIFIVVIIISVAFNAAVLQANNSKNEKQIITQEQAAKHAAKLANEKCQKDFGHSPFTPESYKAELVVSKWHWGKIDPIGIYGYSAKVEFCKDGSDENVRVTFHTDALDSRYKIQKIEIPIEKIETKKIKLEVEKVLPNIDDRKEK